MFIPLHEPTFDQEHTRAICIGSGRFLRAVLVPFFRRIECKVVIAQPRGSDFVKACEANKGSYELDTIDRDGKVSTNTLQVEGVGSLGSDSGRDAFMKLPKQLPQLRFIGIGVTESGISSDSDAMCSLVDLLYQCFRSIPSNTISVLSTDNFPRNGDSIKRCVDTLVGRTKAFQTSDHYSKEYTSFQNYIYTQVIFHNTIVDRITSHRPDDVLVPLAEPSPRKTLIIEDLKQGLGILELRCMRDAQVRHKSEEFAVDEALKLNVANATHTAMVYLMALSRISNTRHATDLSILQEHLQRLFHLDILPALGTQGVLSDVATQMYEEWMTRVRHKHLGLDTFWVCQNALFKFQVRLFSIVKKQMEAVPSYRPSLSLAFVAASILRFLTPISDNFVGEPIVFKGKMDPLVNEENGSDSTPRDSKSWFYSSGLKVDFFSGEYDFQDGSTTGIIGKTLYRATAPILTAMRNNGKKCVSAETSADVGVAVSFVLNQMDDFDLSNPIHAEFASTVTALYHRMLTGSTCLEVLSQLLGNKESSEPLQSTEEIADFVKESILSVRVVDVHTHLFPPTHGTLMLWGINELITYHYLVAEFFMTAEIDIESFNTLPKEEQARLIWEHLFIQRSPISEACRGVITTLQELGLGHLVAKRDLKGIQEWFKEQDPQEYVAKVFSLAKIRYAVMTNIPFDPQEAQYWLGDPSENIPPASWSRTYFRSALRVDQLLLGDWESIEKALDVFDLSPSVKGCRKLLTKWIEIMQPEYFMASVPIDFQYPSSDMGSDSNPSARELLLYVLLPLAEEKKLPIALKFDSVRPINAALGVAGDGLQPSNVNTLIALCRDFPRVKFLATFLSRVNQHQVTVVANKFANLHLYGCWWYCNNPSIIDELTRMRLEILGTAFTAQHSDARVLDQLIYKWRHSREVIVPIMVEMYQKLHASGWMLTKAQVQRDIKRLFGGAYEEFMAKQ
uniref:Uncharacterized protein AlNc14C210G8900 n=1 Tax=Albugo laibachii Nc14 TaxID=890382 RepID=F0WR93_9STRA|nr:conserved hypothetical protein [Albugo laibachii Nc14]CCA24039.1 conserved hypothetical protein [Albugo laibachii Nc14]|eukprot:CCA24039.1 conserved hypothetical protein [Albugo laibachii Nc14]